MSEIGMFRQLPMAASLIRVAALAFAHDPAAVGRNPFGKPDEVDTRFPHYRESDNLLRNTPAPMRIR
jgi:hypothetical protein